MPEIEPSNPPAMDVDKIRHRLHLVAHDVRSLLGPITGFAELIATSDDIEQCRAHAARIGAASARLEGLADGLVDLVLDGGEAEAD